MSGAQATRALRAVAPTPLWGDQINLVAEMLDVKATSSTIGSVAVELVYGDVRDRLPDWIGLADAWFLDGFSPAKNPEMWGADLMGQVAGHTRTGGTFATFTAAGAVRRALGDAGFDVELVPGYGRKRHMSRGILA